MNKVIIYGSIGEPKFRDVNTKNGVREICSFGICQPEGKDANGKQKYGSLLYADFTGLTAVFDTPVATVPAYDKDGKPMEKKEKPTESAGFTCELCGSKGAAESCGDADIDDILACGKAYKVVHGNALKTNRLLKSKANTFFSAFGN